MQISKGVEHTSEYLAANGSAYEGSRSSSSYHRIYIFSYSPIQIHIYNIKITSPNNQEESLNKPATYL